MWYPQSALTLLDAVGEVLESQALVEKAVKRPG